ncbi:aldo/keto reductase family protein [Flammeovirga agarivorans]|uniref:Aldo/keto reductase n=1 Tax=Flammeovirga agarivorans TaxID=2726742 RepID=A0A7X8SI65_9BACT|nr:aldo/keto reductase [Flammeovirga agarivorans]NLR90659.1 aldo/keto reductase [Flammeovirga agarivorans]
MINSIKRKFPIYDMRGTFALRNTVRIPFLGMNVSQIHEGKPIFNATKRALQIGYRHFDCATKYNNINGVGQAIKESQIDRNDVFISLKIGDEFHGFENTIEVYHQLIAESGLRYIDLLLIEHPLENVVGETWRALEQLYVERRVRAIGVCNYTKPQLQELVMQADVFPVVNQVEFNVLKADHELMEYCVDNGIQLVSIGALKHGEILDLPEIQELAIKYKVEPPQIALRWILQNGVVSIPQAELREHLLINSALFNFELSDEDMLLLDQLSQKELVQF